MTLQKFVQNENIKELTKNTGIPGRTLYDIRYGTYKNARRIKICWWSKCIN